MSIQDLGSLGEFVAAIATIGTLIYLALQIRQNTRQLSESAKALRRAEMNATMENYSDLRRLQMSDSRISDIVVQANSDISSLSEGDRLRYDAYLTELLWINCHVWERVEHGILEPAQWQRAKWLVRSLINGPGGLDLWQRRKAIYPEGYAMEVEYLIDDSTDAQ